jgi:hypothetical protein
MSIISIIIFFESSKKSYNSKLQEIYKIFNEFGTVSDITLFITYKTIDFES